ncbi:MAG: septum formation inhibitor Maf [Acidobacteria bacterium]|nr:septum formation inhibitor Maf [Acidobacteriota bacterium]
MINLPKLILASGSPRRAEILNLVGWEFEKRVADIDEIEFFNEKPDDYVQRLAQEKAEFVAENYENALVLGADTIVVIDEKIIGKPKDLDDARRMLELLSGRWHKVLTGVALVRKEREKKRRGKKEKNPKSKIQNPKSVVRLQTTRVKFAALSDVEIEYLVENGEPLNKAGAYAVQAQAALFIEEIQGDYWNVVGLPINQVYRMAKEICR